MRKFIDTKSLKFKMWTYFTLFSVFIFVMLWLFQIIFLNTYYESMKINEIRKIAKEVTALNTSENFEEVLYKTAFNNGVIIQFYNKFGEPVLDADSPMLNRFSRWGREEVKKIIKSLNETEAGEIISYIKNTQRPDTHFVVAGAKFVSKEGEPYYLTFHAPLAPISATTEVLKNQLLIVTVILLIIAFALSYFIAKIISKPLLKITDSAKNLAKGDYSIVFEKGSYSEINSLASALNYATEELSKTDSLRRDLIANVSHDLRTPLTVIKSYAEMLRDFSGEHKEKRELHLKTLIDETDKMSALVDDILDLSKAENGVFSLSKSRFSLADCVRECVGRMMALSENSEFSFEVFADDPCYVRADEQKISQVVYNLVANAINYTGEDKKVIISVEKSNDKVKFLVKDTGEGIAKSEITKVWDRYYRSEMARQKNAAGTGIGLSIVKNILISHEADFGVISEEGSGSVFWFELSEDK